MFINSLKKIIQQYRRILFEKCEKSMFRIWQVSGEREIWINRLFQNKSLFVFQWFDPSDNGRRERDGAFLYHYVDLCLIIVFVEQRMLLVNSLSVSLVEQRWSILMTNQWCNPISSVRQLEQRTSPLLRTRN